MSDVTKAKINYSRRRPRRHYDTPRWQDMGALFPGKDFVRKAVEKTSGREVVIKHVFGSEQRRKRFYDEAVNMYRMNGTPGILPVWDMDDIHPQEPHWYAMPHAQLLSHALGDDATLRDVVEAVAFLADVLARLADQGTYHRDIKPANIFWYGGSAVLADFGIAAWGDDAAHRASPTLKSEKLGPANFIAPEMRYNRPENRGKHADVYSLAKTLFVLALPSRSPYPPDGTHRADRDEFSLWETHGGSSLPPLRHVLEAATEFDQRHRLSMAEFRDELYAWLDQYAVVEFRRRGDRPRFRSGWDGLDAISERHRRDREETMSMMRSCIHKIAAVLTGDPEAWTEAPDHEGGEVLGVYGWEPTNDEDDFIPDNGTIWMATEVSGGRRIVLWAVLDDDVCFIAESQAEGAHWTLEKQWGPTQWGRPRMLSTANQVRKLAEDVITWIAKTAPDGQSATDAR